MNTKYSIINIKFIFMVILFTVAARGQNEPNYVSQEQYNNLKQELETGKNS